MIQFNLLPDIKQEYIRTQRVKRMVLGISMIASGVALFVLLLLLFTVYIVQKKSITDLNKDIQSNSSTLKNTPHIADILTVQSQLNSLVSLNAQKPAATRLFGYLSQLTPVQATISDLKVDYVQHTMTIDGNAPGLDVVNTFIDGLKFTTFTVKGESDTDPAFSSVVLASFSRSSKSATYSVTFNFDPAVFDNSKEVTLTVGGQLQSQASAQQPSIIFKKGD